MLLSSDPPVATPLVEMDDVVLRKCSFETSIQRTHPEFFARAVIDHDQRLAGVLGKSRLYPGADNVIDADIKVRS